MFSAILFGLRLSLTVGVVATACALAIGTAVGIMAAYVGGRVETTLMRLVDVQLSFPAILIALILLALPRQGSRQGDDRARLGAVGLLRAHDPRLRAGRAPPRIHRGRALPRPAAVAASCSAICCPTPSPPLIVVATVQVAHAIALEATLSFLGVGVPITEPSLGLLIANGYSYMLSGNSWIAFYPGVALLVVIAAINLVGDRLRDVMNPRLQH